MSIETDSYLTRSGGRLACPHPQHRFAQVPDSPARIILPECAGRERWLAARQQGIGGSEVAALVGTSEYDTPWSVFNNKIIGGKDLSDQPQIEWGHRLENVVAEKTAEEIGMVSRFAGGLWAHLEKPHLRVTPDRFATAPRSWKAQAVIECKTAGDDEHWESGTIHPSRHGTGSAPVAYQAQVQWQLGILGLKVGYLGCFHVDRSRQFFTVEIHFDADWFAEMVAAADDMWFNHVLTGEPPMHDLHHPKTVEMLKGQHPAVVRPSVDLPEDTEEWLLDYVVAKNQLEAAERRVEAAKNFLRMMTGDAGSGYLGDKKVVSYPAVPTTKVDVGLLKERYPKIAEEVTVRNSHRRLTITVPKDIKKKAEQSDS